MDKPLINNFRIQLKSLTGFEFQEIVIKILQFYFGLTNTTDIRPQKDKGCDCIIENENRVVACFGPKENLSTIKRQKDFCEKLNHDFELFTLNWKNNYQNWSFIINHEIDPYYDMKIKALSSNTSIIGLNQLLAMIESTNSCQRRQLGKLLSIEPEYFSRDFIKEILDDLLKEDENDQFNITYKPKDLTEITEKIEINFSNEEVDEIIIEFDIYWSNGLFYQIDTLLYGYEDKEIDKIKIRLINDFNQVENVFFKEKLNKLSTKYLEKYSSENDDEYFFIIRGLILYLFEQCLIGKKTKGEE